MARPVQQIKSHSTGGAGGLLLALGLVNQMRAGHASTARFSIPQPAGVMGPGTSSQDGISGKLHRSRRRPARGSANALNSKAMPVGKCIAPQMVWTAAGMAPRTFKSPQGEPCPLRCRSGTGPDRGRVEGPGGAFYYWGPEG